VTALLIYTTIVAALAISTIRWPATAIAGIICMFGLEQWAQGSHPLFLQHRALTNYVIGFIVLLGLAKKIYRGQPILRAYPAVGILVLTLFLYALVSTTWAPYPDRSLAALLTQSPYIITIIILAPLLCSNTEDIERAFFATCVLGLVLLVLLMFTVEWKNRSVVFPGSSFHGNPAAIGALGGTISIIAAYFRWPKLRLLDILKWIVVALGLTLAIRSGSRGQTLAAVMVLVVCWPLAYRLHSFKAYTIFGAGIIFIAATTFWGLDMFWPDSGRWDANAMEDAADGRLYRSSKIYKHWFTTPATIFFGVGNSASKDLIGTYAHVLPLDILCEEGVAGFVMFIGIVLLCVNKGFKGFFLVRDNPQQRTQLAILCAIFAYYFASSLKQGNLLGSPLLFLCAILIGTYYNNLVSSRRQHTEPPRRNYSIAGFTRP